jgi:large subunit ribosomal protein LP2
LIQTTLDSEKMLEIAALVLCKLGGKSGSAEDIKAVFAAAGLEGSDDEIATLTGDIGEKDLDALLAEGMEKIKDIPIGGSGGGGGGGGYVVFTLSVVYS